ncbi:hypothetical protein [Streptomyces colonosanans]|uniref:Uncharacterized protein n=1 Tax=Streptomyces colonosanans TaxID=1428652 RepID=A0A1S2NTG8_9ACTN|nr:hypothetical protein [Streptomyces colonosanans]OIJ84671.1 hypothetical protein BIV24_30480 [Streptomyces colonosanans]
MTTAEDRRSGASRVVLRCTRVAAIALVAVLAVLVHHETATPMTHVQPSSRMVEAIGMAGMDHGSAPPARSRSDAPALLSGATAPVAVGPDGPCSGMAMQHCSAAGVDTVKLVPPAGLAVGHTPAAPSRAAAGRDIPGTVSRAPPDLSLLSRLLL